METEEERRKAKALFRFGIIFPLLDDQLSPSARSRMIGSIVSKEYDVPGSRKHTFSKETVLKWLRDYRRNPNIDSLVPAQRNDRNRRRRLTPETEQALLRLHDQFPDRPLKAVVRMAEQQGLFGAGDTMGMASIYRMFQKHAAESVDRNGKDMRRFEASRVNETWQTDCMHGPKVLYGGRTITAMLFAFIDDCSRLCVYGRFYPDETTDSFLDCMWESFRRRGLPRRIYTDHGSAECNRRVRYGLASLEVILSLARVRAAASKGKIERFWGTVRRQFLATLPVETVTLDELNKRWAVWMDDYNKRPHSALWNEKGDHISPLQRYLQEITAVRKAPDDLPRYFWNREARVVSNARTVSIANRLFQTPIGYAGRKIEVRWWTLDHVEGFFQDKPLGVLPPVDMHANADCRRSVPNTQGGTYHD